MIVKTHPNNFLSKPAVYKRDFIDLDEFVDLLNQSRNYQVYPLNRNLFQYQLTQIDLGVIKFIKTKVDYQVHLVGDRLKDWREFIVYLNCPPRPIWNNCIPLSCQHLFGFANHCEANFVLPTNLVMGSFRIQEEYFQQYLKTINYLEIDPDFLRRDYAFLSTALEPIQAYLKNLFCLMDTFPEQLDYDNLQKLILEDFIPLLMDAIAPKPEVVTPTISPRYRHQLVKEVRDYMIANLGKPITLKDLCQNVFASTRSISYGFQEVFGISPMSYLKILRLHGVRHALKQAEPTTHRVQNIAKEFGFWSMGHFTRDYKSFFGELPSVTLSQTRRGMTTQIGFKP